jgi:small-conductance mechanosensitive channel
MGIFATTKFVPSKVSKSKTVCVRVCMRCVLSLKLCLNHLSRYVQDLKIKGDKRATAALQTLYYEAHDAADVDLDTSSAAALAYPAFGQDLKALQELQTAALACHAELTKTTVEQTAAEKDVSEAEKELKKLQAAVTDANRIPQRLQLEFRKASDLVQDLQKKIAKLPAGSYDKTENTLKLGRAKEELEFVQAQLEHEKTTGELASRVKLADAAFAAQKELVESLKKRQSAAQSKVALTRQKSADAVEAVREIADKLGKVPEAKGSFKLVSFFFKFYLFIFLFIF